jgi:hypothetical protein
MMHTSKFHVTIVEVFLETLSRDIPMMKILWHIMMNTATP